MISKLNRVDCRVDLGKGRHKVLHINNMKKVLVEGSRNNEDCGSG